MPKLPSWFIPAVVLMFIIQVAVAYITDASPVFSLIGLIITIVGVLLYRMRRKAP